MPRVTVIIATYNWSTVLPYSIASVLDQTFRDFELLVVGDGCTDDSELVVAGIGDPRVRWINLPEHTGHQSEPNNRGIVEARGEFIAYLGHDDLWLPYHLDCAVEALTSNGAAMSYSILARILPGAAVGAPALPMPEAGLWSPPSCTVHRRDVIDRIGGWRDYRSLTVAPQIELWRRAQAAGFSFVFVPRLTAIKFPASKRRNVYRTRPCHEQEAWLRRIRTEPNLEAEQLVQMMTGDEAVQAMRLRKLGRLFVALTGERLASKLSSRLRRSAPGAEIAAYRKFKGL